MRFRINHVTRYTYTDPVSLYHGIVHLKPAETMGSQRCLSATLRIDPWPSVNREHRDFFGNRVNYFSIQQSHAHLEVTALSEVEVQAPDLPDPASTLAWESVLKRLREHKNPTMVGARIFCLPSPMVPSNRAATHYAAQSFPPGRPILEGTCDLMARIFHEFDYDPNFTTVATPVKALMEHRRGVCQDFAHVAIAGLRGLGFAVRYVSGYLETLPPPGQVKLQGSDASHAWFSVLIPDLGWVDFDPTNNQIPGEQHITTAIGRDFSDVTPMRGIFYGGGTHDLTVAVDVNRIES